MQVSTAVSELTPKLAFSEIMSFAYDTFCSNKVRFMLTALGMVIGTASLILVVTIGLTGKQYVLNQIQGIGANLIYAEYEGGAQRITSTAPDPLTVDDHGRVRHGRSAGTHQGRLGTAAHSAAGGLDVWRRLRYRRSAR